MDENEDLPFGSRPISDAEWKQYASGCAVVVRILEAQVVDADDPNSISTVKGMFNRVVKQDRRDWKAVRTLLGEPEVTVARECAVWLGALRRLAVAGLDTKAQLAQPIAQEVGRRVIRASEVLAEPP